MCSAVRPVGRNEAVRGRRRTGCRWADPGRGLRGAHAVAQREPRAYCRGGSAMSIAFQIRRSVRAGKLHNGWVGVLLCSPVGLIVAVVLLHGAAQGWVGMLSVVVALFAACRLLDTEDFRRIERSAPSTFNETTMPGSSYMTFTGSPRPESPPVGPVNTPRQDEIDALNRVWRAPANDPP